MGFAILRLRKRQLGAARAMAGHALRVAGMAPNADPAKTGENTLLAGSSSVEAVMASIEQALPAKRRRDAVPVIEFMVGMSPEDAGRLGRVGQDAYFRDALAFLAQRFGGQENVKLAVIHRDETTPHLQALVVPLVDGKLQANRCIGGPSGLRRLQDDFAAAAGAAAGLQRGVRGSRARHTTVKQFYGALEAAGSLQGLPPRAEVPPEPTLTDRMTGRAGAIEQARHQAVTQNQERQRAIEALARVGLASRGYQARQAGRVLARSQEERAAAKQAQEEAQKALQALKASEDRAEHLLQQAHDTRAEAMRLAVLAQTTARAKGLNQVEAQAREIEHRVKSPATPAPARKPGRGLR